MTTQSIRLVADSPAGTAEVAKALAGHLRAGDAVLLHGGLAAGSLSMPGR